MDTKGKKRIVIWVSIAALLGVGGYFAYKFVKAKRDKKKAEEEAKKVSESASSTPTSSGNSVPKADDYNSARNTAIKNNALAFKFGGKIYHTENGRVLTNPFTSKEQLKAAQTYVYYTLNDTAIGIPDGEWGVKSASALIKYGTAYLLGLKPSYSNTPTAYPPR